MSDHFYVFGLEFEYNYFYMPKGYEHLNFLFSELNLPLTL